MTAIQLPRQCCGTCKWWTRKDAYEATIGVCTWPDNKVHFPGCLDRLGNPEWYHPPTTDMQLCSKWEAAD